MRMRLEPGLDDGHLMTAKVLNGNSIHDNNNSNPCIGDSGSPLVANLKGRGGRSVLVGLAVTGSAGCEGDGQVGFVRVSGAVSGWIKETAGIRCP